MFKSTLPLLLLLGLLTPLPARSATVVAVSAPRTQGDIDPPIRQLLQARLLAGLRSTGLRVIPPEQTASAGVDAPCAEASCRRQLAAALEARYLVGAAVQGEDRFYALELWAADGYSGKKVATVRRQCEICGQQAVAQAMELSAAALAAKLQALGAAKQPARVIVQSEPPGAQIAIDGDPVGQAPQTLELPAGEHQLTLFAPGYLGASRTLQAVAGVEEQLQLKLIPLPRPSWKKTAGWTAVGLGAASLVAGVVLLALDGRAVGCAGELAGQLCPERRQTAAAGWTLTSLGAATLLGGGTLLLWPPPK